MALPESSGADDDRRVTTTTDDRLRREVLEELAGDGLIDESQIDVKVEGGVVTLVGTVASYAEKLVAQLDAQGVEEVHDIINAIDVKPAGKTTHPSDVELAAMIEQVLAWNALVPEQHLEVTASDGWITLRGTCAAEAQRSEAERAIERLAGVRGVTNLIETAEPELSIDDVRRAISEALVRRAAHRAAMIDVVVDGHSVTLTGVAQSANEKQAILGIVSHAPGVEKVLDGIEVDAST